MVAESFDSDFVQEVVSNDSLIRFSCHSPYLEREFFALCKCARFVNWILGVTVVWITRTSPSFPYM